MRYAPLLIRIFGVLALTVFSAWLGADVAHAQNAVDWRYYGILPACNNPCGPGIGPACVYPGDPGDYQYAYYTLDGVIELMVNIMRWIFSISGALALLMFVWGGFQLLISRGEASTIKEGKQTIQNALIGIFLIFGAWMIVNFFVSALIDETPEQPISAATRATRGFDLWKYNNKNTCKKPDLDFSDKAKADNLKAGVVTPPTDHFSRSVSLAGHPSCVEACRTIVAGNPTLSVDGFVKRDTQCDCNIRVHAGGRECSLGCRDEEYCNTSSNKCESDKSDGQPCQNQRECRSNICTSGKCAVNDGSGIEGVCCVERFMSNDQPHNYQPNSSTTRANCAGTFSSERLSIKFCPKNTSCTLADAGGCETLR